MVAHGAAVLVPDAELDEQRFGDELVRLLRDPEQRATMAAASRALGPARRGRRRDDSRARPLGTNHDPQDGGSSWLNRSTRTSSAPAAPA